MKSKRSAQAGGRRGNWSVQSRRHNNQASTRESSAILKTSIPNATLAIHAPVEFKRAYIQLALRPEFLTSALDAVGVEGWNDLRRRLLEEWTVEMRVIPSIVVTLDFTGVRLARRQLDGIDLRSCILHGADFTCCTLRRAHFDDVAGACFRGADLRLACFTGCDLTATDFTDASCAGMTINVATYDKGAPPIRLSTDTLAACMVLPWDCRPDSIKDCACAGNHTERSQ